MVKDQACKNALTLPHIFFIPNMPHHIKLKNDAWSPEKLTYIYPNIPFKIMALCYGPYLYQLILAFLSKQNTYATGSVTR